MRLQKALHFRGKLLARQQSSGACVGGTVDDHNLQVRQIACDRLAERRGLTQSGGLLDGSPAAIAKLAEGGFSAELGARALRRHLDRVLLAPAARLLAKAGSEGHGGTLTVRTPDEEPGTRKDGARIGEATGDVNVTLW